MTTVYTCACGESFSATDAESYRRHVAGRCHAAWSRRVAVAERRDWRHDGYERRRDL